MDAPQGKKEGQGSQWYVKHKQTCARSQPHGVGDIRQEHRIKAAANAIYGEEHNTYQYGQSHTETKSAQWSQATAIIGMTGLNMKIESGCYCSEIKAGYQHGPGGHS